MRARTPSGHDASEYFDQRLAKVELASTEITGHRVRLDQLERFQAKIETKLDITGQHSVDGQLAAAQYKAVIEQRDREKAELSAALEKKVADEQRNKRMDVLYRLVFLLLGIIAGAFGATHTFHAP